MKLVFVHGFQGSFSSTFRKFPYHLQTVFDHKFEVVGYDYETSGPTQVQDFVQWINRIKDQIIIICHSMGGILVLDAILKHSVKAVAVLAFDSPFFGLQHANLISSGVETANQLFASASSSKWIGIASVAVAAGAAFVASKSSISTHVTSLVSKKLEFLGPLWKPLEANDRFIRLNEYIYQNTKFQFHCFYTSCKSGTFIQLNPDYANYFSEIKYKKMENVIDAHTQMFDGTADADAYKEVLNSTVEWLIRHNIVSCYLIWLDNNLL
jgi:pimeloyl-ACP methyl ester carboxylesterase